MKAGLADKQSQQASHEQHSVRMLAANLDLAARSALLHLCLVYACVVLYLHSGFYC